MLFAVLAEGAQPLAQVSMDDNRCLDDSMDPAHTNRSVHRLGESQILPADSG